MEQRVKTAVPLTTLVTYSCGCHFHTRKESEAKFHVTETGHTLTINGTIGPIKPRYFKVTGDIPKDGTTY